MELLNFRLNLNQSKTSYEFEDVQVQIFDDLTATIEGNIEIEFDIQEDVDRTFHFVDTAEICVQTIYDGDDEPIGLSESLMNQLKNEIENSLNSFDVENH